VSRRRLGGGRASRPALKLEKRAPIVVSGVHFKSRERVRVTVMASGAKETRSVRTSGAGSFTASFDVSAGDRCNGVRAYAVGAAGDTAYLKPLPLPACMPVRKP
jgi:hypothetical protein